MDWFSWLSKTNLEPSLVYEYGLSFARNELQLEDASHFNHELLQSMGISIAKHRLEILKLAKKKEQNLPPPETTTKKLKGVIKKCLRKCLSKLQVKDTMLPPAPPPPEPNWYHQQGKWRRALVRDQEHKGMHRSRTIAMSGPLDCRMNEKMFSNNKVLRFSGPLDGIGKLNERNVVCTTNCRSSMMTRPMDGRFMDRTAKSPRFSGPIDPRLTRPFSDEWAESPMGYSPFCKTRTDSDYDDSALWSKLFEDLKPT